MLVLPQPKHNNTGGGFGDVADAEHTESLGYEPQDAAVGQDAGGANGGHAPGGSPESIMVYDAELGQ